MSFCRHADCTRRPIPNGAYCDTHTRHYLTDAFAPEWVRRAQRHQLPVRIEGGKAA